MFKKSITALTAALVVATTIVSAADAQTAQRGTNVRPFTAAEKLWFQIPEAPERIN
jgi:hypothetical protein